MSTLDLSITQLAGVSTNVGRRTDRSEQELLVVGPSLGTSVGNLWQTVAERLGSSFTVLGWDLPGHGASAPARGFSLSDLAAAVTAAVDGWFGGAPTFHYAGDSLGGAVGLYLLLEMPDRVNTATLCCTGAKIGEPEGWYERAAAVRAQGMVPLVGSAPERWFGPGYRERSPKVAAALLDDLARSDPESYAAACDALARHDVRDRLAEIDVPVLAVAGRSDPVITPTTLRHIAAGVQSGRLVVLDGVAHLAPAEAPDRVADLILVQSRVRSAARTTAQVRAEGLKVRREVLGDGHVDRSLATLTELTQDFQDFITTYAWGSIWTRPGLDRRSRSIITLTALIARGHHEELAMHLRAARTNGLTNVEIAEVLLQTAIYCGVPEANTAFRIAQQVLGDLDAGPAHGNDRGN